MMFDALVEKTPALLIPIFAILGTGLVFLVWIIAHHWHKVRQLEAETALKKDMLARDFAPADIERVLLASARRAEAAESKETISDNEYYLVEKMLDDGHSVEDVERLVRAFKSGDRSAFPKDERVMT